eukprot:7776505-Pyramimonas_sp.AAC.1
MEGELSPWSGHRCLSGWRAAICILAEPTWAEEFCAIDVRQLRAAALCVNVPPSGVSSAPNVPAVGGEVEVEAMYTCMIVNESGEVCGRALPDRRALPNHLV